MISIVLLLAPAVLVAADPPAESTAAPPAEKAADLLDDYSLVWFDDFEGDSLDTDKWRYRTGPRLGSVQCPENVSIADGKLRIALKKERSGDLNHTAGGVISKKALRYGYYEARFKMPRDRGWHSSFFLCISPTPAIPILREIDICEQNSGFLHYTVNAHEIVVQGTDKSLRSIGVIRNGTRTFRRVPTPDLSADFHTWGAEFTPEHVKFFFDGSLVSTADMTDMKHGDFNIWLTSVARRTVDDSNLPAYMLFDWVRYYRKRTDTK